VGLSSQSGTEIEDNRLCIAIGRQGDIGWHNFLLGQTARHFEAIQQEYISATRQWNITPFWAKKLTLVLWEFGWTVWKHRNELLNDSTGVDRIPKRELNNSVTQEWQNGDTNLLAQDKPKIQGTTLHWLLQTSDEHKLAWLVQIRLARLAYATAQNDDTPTSANAEATETTHAP
jgi:hypothetical protein